MQLLPVAQLAGRKQNTGPNRAMRQRSPKPWTAWLSLAAAAAATSFSPSPEEAKAAAGASSQPLLQGAPLPERQRQGARSIALMLGFSGVGREGLTEIEQAPELIPPAFHFPHPAPARGAQRLYFAGLQGRIGMRCNGLHVLGRRENGGKERKRGRKQELMSTA